MAEPQVRRAGENALAVYYAVTDKETSTVRHGTHPTRPFACLRCCKNDCEHIDAVIDYLTISHTEAA
jgi:hypothetical protein